MATIYFHLFALFPIYMNIYFNSQEKQTQKKVKHMEMFMASQGRRTLQKAK